jgi:hypothetical protein
MLSPWRNADQLLLGLRIIRNVYNTDFFNLREGMLQKETELVILLSGDKEISFPNWIS